MGVSIIQLLVPTDLRSYMLVESIKVTSSTWWGFSVCKTSQDIVKCIPWRGVCGEGGDPGPCPKATLVFLHCSCLVFASPPSPD